MANWLEKVFPPVSTGRNLPVRRPPGRPLSSARGAPPAHLPNASIIYGIAASMLIILAVYFLFTRLWLSGLLILLPAGCFLGFSLHFLRHPH